MRAIIKEQDTVVVRDIEQPRVQSADDVVICVKIAGLCRTDVFMADGLIQGKDTVILGHEFAGVVAEAGADANGLTAGERVTVMPVMPCGECGFCNAGAKDSCQNTTMLGIHHDGAFAEYIRVPANTVYRLPDNLSFTQGAYSEPVAAALSVMKAGISPQQRGFIYGSNRFAQLILRIMQSYGFNNVVIHDPQAEKLEDNVYDFAIETLATTQAMEKIFRAVRPRGTVVIRSRKHEPVGIVFDVAVKKELTLQAVNYGPFDEAIALMADGRIKVDDLLGSVYALEEFSAVFAASKKGESSKVFFKPESGPCAE
ncbi:MAG: L-threonine 3-dehydrogenase [Micavibrio sp.]|nr:MAG: L-threonine 3-dehydrogenase [Micavibrio sp.]